MPLVQYNPVLRQFVAESTFQEREIMRQALWSWHPERKEWFTSRPQEAVRLYEYADPQARRQIDRTRVRINDSPPAIDCPAGLELDPAWQPQGVNFLLTRNRSYLSDRPGLGKTIQAAVAARSMRSPVLYVCPPYAALNIRKEFRKWYPELDRIHILSGRYDGPELPNLLIVPDNKLADERSMEFAKKTWDYWMFAHDCCGDTIPWLFVDEAHRFKNEDTQRTGALFSGVIPFFDRVTLMSGTPMPNRRPLEIWPVINHVVPGLFDYMWKDRFINRYYRKRLKVIGREKDRVDRHGNIIKGKLKKANDLSEAANFDELMKKLEPFMYGRDESVLGLRPPREDILLIGEKISPRLMSLEKEVLKKLDPQDLAEDRIAISHGKDGELHVSSYRMGLGEEKAKKSIPVIQAILESEDKLVVFAHHKPVIDILKEGLKAYNPCVVTGSVDKAKRSQLEHLFQTDPNRRIWLANLEAGGVSWTLTAARRAIFVEASWVPGDNRQAWGRIYRKGSTGQIYVQYVCFEQSLDRRILEANLKKEGRA